MSLKAAIDIAGSQLALAKRIGVKQSYISNWLNRDKQGVPARYVILIEKATGVPRHELRPDIYPKDSA